MSSPSMYDTKIGHTGDEKTILTRDEKAPKGAHGDVTGSRDDKATLADGDLARQLQDQLDQEGSSSSDAAFQASEKSASGKGGDEKRGLAQSSSFGPPAAAPPQSTSRHKSGYSSSSTNAAHNHTNPVLQAGKLRAINEQEMQNWLQQLQYSSRIYNSEIEPEHESDYPCNCPIHQFMRAKWSRCTVQDAWNAAVLYPGEKAYNGNRPYQANLLSGNPYQYRVVSPYGPFNINQWGPKIPSAKFHALFITQTIALNNSLNKEAQAKIDAKEPKVNIWDDDSAESAMSRMTLKGAAESSNNTAVGGTTSKTNGGADAGASGAPKLSKLSRLRSSMGIKSSEERSISKAGKEVAKTRVLRDDVLREEQGRWPDQEWREIVRNYQEKTGMAKKIGDLRARQPIQYYHLLRAGYFEPIPVAWANSVSNPLKFTIEASAGWRGITPAWRGYEDTAEERLYWVMNHREGSTGTRMKPDFVSALDMARERMGKAVEPPPEYYDANDICHVQHTTDGYSKQVMPPPFRAFDRPENPTDDTMILLDISGSMDFDPQSPNYDRYLVTGFRTSTQPKNKDVAKAIIRRFTDAMMNHDHSFGGYDLTTFSSSAHYVGTVNHKNLNALWDTIRIGGGTRVMTGWQKVKELHFEKHSASAIHHPIYGWQAGPKTPILRLLLLLDGEATDMDEFELDLLGLSWAHVTIFLIGVDGCPHHHRHANELQRISDVNHHVSFVDAQGNTPERYVTHELLKRHLGYDVSLQEYKELEIPPTYHEATR